MCLLQISVDIGFAVCFAMFARCRIPVVCYNAANADSHPAEDAETGSRHRATCYGVAWWWQEAENSHYTTKKKESTIDRQSM